MGRSGREQRGVFISAKVASSVGRVGVRGRQSSPPTWGPSSPRGCPPGSSLVGTRTRPPVTGYTHDQEGALKAFTNSGQGLAAWKGQGPNGDRYCQLFLHFT